jgi:hypothetical protein
MTTEPSAKEDDAFQRLGERLARTTKRSAFAAWLAQGRNYVRLKEQIDARGVRWDEIAAWAFEEGHTGEKRITGIAAKRTYDREAARREKTARARAKPGSPPGTALLNPLLPPAMSPRREPLPGDDGDFVFTPLKRRPKEERE